MEHCPRHRRRHRQRPDRRPAKLILGRPVHRPAQQSGYVPWQGGTRQRPGGTRSEEPRHIGGGKYPGFKLFIGDLPQDCTSEQFGQWVRADPAMQEPMQQVTDMQVSGGSQTGLRKAIITFRTASAAAQAHSAFWRWWGPVPRDVESRGWRWFQVRVMTPR